METNEISYQQGYRAAMVYILRRAMSELGYEPELEAARLVVQVEEVRAAVAALYEAVTGAQLDLTWNLADAIRHIEKEWPDYPEEE